MEPLLASGFLNYCLRVRCPSCGTENEAGRKFCGECGSALAHLCANCGTANPPNTKFCGECGSPLAAPATRGEPETADAASRVVAAERRLVSVLFADLVGFTSLSESRDAEDVRELLSTYFETAQRVIASYGGVVEKFIGDAVMAVWGTPVAMEDDAERAVRAALELVDAVANIGSDVGAHDLMLRAGVLTGEAAVTIGATGQGMVAGDLVNTASRLQSAADPGTVLVGEVTRRASEAAIAYEDAGEFEVKGKVEPVHAWSALRVVAASGGAGRRTILEPPFVGRDRDLRTVKEVYLSCRQGGKAHLISVIGIAGIGKSRLSWEFEKYIDGLVDDAWWHRGRCLAYGEGVTYWALAEMVRMRAVIAEDEDADSGRAKLHAVVEEIVSDPEERAWIEPALGHLLGYESGSHLDRDSLFSAWRMFFERMSDADPVIMVFEDLHWADEGLLHFIDHLLEWSRDHPIFLLTLARPDLTDRRPEWGIARRNLTSLFLEPLSADQMHEVLQGTVPGLSERFIDRISERAEGVPLYAVETVRMLLDRGVVTNDDGRYRVADEAAVDLEVPESLQALISARLDGLAADEKQLLQDAAVLGKTFTKQALASMTGAGDEKLDTLLVNLVRKDLLAVQADPRSPERGQYGFLQALVQKVAYDMLSRRERKTRHLKAAQLLSEAWAGLFDEVAEVISSHYLEAYRAAPDDDDAAEIKTRARDTLVAAGERAASLGANADALRYYREAAALTDDPVAEADLSERAGDMAFMTQDPSAREWYERAIDLFKAQGLPHRAASVSASYAELLWDLGLIEASIESMEQAFAVLSQLDPTEEYATLAAQLGRFHVFMGNTELASERIEQAIELGEELWLPAVLSEALNTKSVILIKRPQESLALQERSLAVALENDATAAALRAYYNLMDRRMQQDQFAEALRLTQDAFQLARRVGNAYYHSFIQSMLLSIYFLTGRWDDMQGVIDEMGPGQDLKAVAFQDWLVWAPMLKRARGEIDELRDVVSYADRIEGSVDVQEAACYSVAHAVRSRLEGDLVGAFESALGAKPLGELFGPGAPPYKAAMIEAIEVGLELGDLDAVQKIIEDIDAIPVGLSSPYLSAQGTRAKARLAAQREDPREAESLFAEAVEAFEIAGTPFARSVTSLEFAEWMGAIGRDDQARALLDAAEAGFEALGAAPWLERVRAARSLTH